MRIVNRCVMSILRQAGLRRFSRNKVHSNGGQVGETRIVEVEFKLV